ncbi:hypothetical protein CPB86DRAFT_195640 [Serendipita vermifera]|nr:hypothetical protein CPB86DRAFT_195640 [Serendipita vermifera]
MAVYRVPLEIWEEILIYSISDPILPSSDDPPLRAILLLQHDCEASRKVEVIRAQLRSVCRSWNEIIKRLSVQFVYEGDLKTTPIPPFSLRVEFEELGWHWRCRPEKMSNEMTSMKNSYPYVEALIAWDQYRRQPDLERFPNIRVLSTKNFDPAYISIRFPALIRNLTHLQVCLIYSKGPSREELAFPSLHTLCINFEERFYRLYNNRYADTNSGGVNCLNWSLPNLVNLKCFGQVTDNLASRVIYELIERFGSTLKGFFMDVYTMSDHYRHIYLALPENLWKQCTLLETLGTSLTNITSRVRPPHGDHLLRLIFCDIDEPDHWQCGDPCVENERRWMDYEVSISLFIALGWQVDTLQMDISWDELEGRISEFDFPDGMEMLYNFLDRLRWIGRDLMDKHGDGFESERGNGFVIWLEDA